MNRSRIKFGEEIEERRRQLFLVIITAIAFAFLLNILASFFTSIVFAGMEFPRVERYIIALIILTFIIALLLFKLLEPPTVIRKKSSCTILYNIEKGEILHYPSDYWPQGLAHQAFDSLCNKEEKYKKNLKENLANLSREYREGKKWKNPEDLDEYKYIFSHFMEYLFIYWLNFKFLSIMFGFMEKNKISEKELKFENFPSNLKNNIFLSLFNTIEPKERALCQVLNLELPKCFKVEYISPQPIPNRIPDPNSGEMRLKWKYGDIFISFYNTSWGFATSARAGPSPTSSELMGIPINPFFQDYTTKHLGEICHIGYMLEFRAEFNSLKLLLCLKTRFYAKIVEKTSEDFKEFFDVDKYAEKTKARQKEDALEKVFEILEEIKSTVKKE